MRKKILKGIKAFNECWFRTCYYHQLIAGLSYYGVPAEYTILNYTADITCDKARGEYSYERKDVLSEEEYEQLTGVRAEKHVYADIESSLIKSVRRNVPVILGQDNFYITYRPEYGQFHNAHFVLVFGYNLDEKVFAVMEHSFASGLDFAMRYVTIDGIEEAYKGFREHCTQYDWTAAELRRNDGEIPLVRRRELVNALCEPLHKARLDDCLNLYEVMTRAESTDTAKAVDAGIFAARHLRTLLLQYQKYCGAEAVLYPLEKAWHCAHFMQGAAIKANHLKSTEIFRSEAVKVKLSTMAKYAREFEKAVRRL